MKKLDKLQELLKDATPEPWIVRTLGDDCFVEGNAVAGQALGRDYKTEILSDSDYPTKKNDCLFVAESRTVMPKLIKALRIALSGLQCNCMQLSDTVLTSCRNCEIKKTIEETL